jgi:hypothetical protein
VSQRGMDTYGAARSRSVASRLHAAEGDREGSDIVAHQLKSPRTTWVRGRSP